MTSGDKQNETIELISFRIDNQEFGLDIMAVREIRGWTQTAPLPHSPGYMRGVINLRGAVLPIVDLKDRLGLGEISASARSVVIVVHTAGRLVGLLVDAVSEILTADRATIQATPDVGCDMVNQFVRGILALEGRMISLIALDDVLPLAREAEAA